MGIPKAKMSGTHSDLNHPHCKYMKMQIRQRKIYPQRDKYTNKVKIIMMKNGVLFELAKSTDTSKPQSMQLIG